MSSTRRRLLAVGGASALPLFSGCSLGGLATENETTTTQSTLNVRLLGPDTERTLFDRTAVVTIGELREPENADGVGLPLTVSDEAASRISTTFQSAGVAENPDQFEIAVLQREQEIDRFGIESSLADRIASGDWDGEFRLSFEQRSDAKTVQRALACGADSAPVSCNQG